jgi:hypothetical protein
VRASVGKDDAAAGEWAGKRSLRILVRSRLDQIIDLNDDLIMQFEASVARQSTTNCSQLMTMTSM